MAKHTEGPWQLGENGLTVYGPGEDPWGLLSLHLYDRQSLARGEGVPDETQRANARLIASAPRLAGALAGLLALVDCGPDSDGHQLRAVREARAALAEAEGR